MLNFIVFNILCKLNGIILWLLFLMSLIIVVLLSYFLSRSKRTAWISQTFLLLLLNNWHSKTAMISDINTVFICSSNEISLIWLNILLLYTGKLKVPRARNNFRIVSGHNDRPNSFLRGHVLFLAGQMYMLNYSFRGP